MAEDLAFMGAVELGKKIARGAVSSVEATKAMLDRIERLNGSLKCYEAVLAVQALGRPGARFVAIADQLNAVCRKRERVIAAPNARSDNSGLRLLSLLSGSFE